MRLCLSSKYFGVYLCEAESLCCQISKNGTAAVICVDAVLMYTSIIIILLLLLLGCGSKLRQRDDDTNEYC